MRDTAATPAKQSAIVLARHGEPALSRRVQLSADGYRRWWAAYEEGGILEGQSPPSGLLELARGADVVFASSRKRAVETADAVAQGKPYVCDSLFVEAPLPPPHLPPFIKFKPRTWGFLARLAWWFGHNEGQETRNEACSRAAEAAERLIAAAKDGATVLLLAHGFFNFMVGRELKRRGWRQSEGRGYKYWAIRRFSPARLSPE